MYVLCISHHWYVRLTAMLWSDVFWIIGFTAFYAIQQYR